MYEIRFETPDRAAARHTKARSVSQVLNRLGVELREGHPVPQLAGALAGPAPDGRHPAPLVVGYTSGDDTPDNGTAGGGDWAERTVVEFNTGLKITISEANTVNRRKRTRAAGAVSAASVQGVPAPPP